MSGDRGRKAYFALWIVQAAAGLAAVPIILLALLGVIDHAVWFIVPWLLLEALAFIFRPWAWKDSDTYRPPGGQGR